jgi:uncharacterized membrane protein
MILFCRKKVQFLSRGLPGNVSALFKISDVFLLSAFTAVTEELHWVFHVEKNVFCRKKTTLFLIIRYVKAFAVGTWRKPSLSTGSPAVEKISGCAYALSSNFLLPRAGICFVFS